MNSKRSFFFFFFVEPGYSLWLSLISPFPPRISQTISVSDLVARTPHLFPGWQCVQALTSSTYKLYRMRGRPYCHRRSATLFLSPCPQNVQPTHHTFFFLCSLLNKITPSHRSQSFFATRCPSLVKKTLFPFLPFSLSCFRRRLFFFWRYLPHPFFLSFSLIGLKIIAYCEEGERGAIVTVDVYV